MVGVFSPVNAVYKAAQVPEKGSWFGQFRYSSHPTETQTDERDGPNAGTECTWIRNNIKTYLLWSLLCHELRCSRPWEGHLWSGPVIDIWHWEPGSASFWSCGVWEGRLRSGHGCVAYHECPVGMGFGKLPWAFCHVALSIPGRDLWCVAMSWCTWGLVFCHNHLLICRMNIFMWPYKNISRVFCNVTFVDVLTVPGLKLLCMGFSSLFFALHSLKRQSKALRGKYLCLQKNYPHHPGLPKLHQLLKCRQKQQTSGLCINQYGKNYHSV